MSLADKVWSTGHRHCSITHVFHAWRSAMGHIQKYHNTLCLSSIIYYKHCLESQEKLKTMLMQNFGGKTKSIMVFFENDPYCMQIPWEKHVQNTCVKNTRKLNTRENTCKLGKFACKSLHAGCYNLCVFSLLEFLHR